MQCLEVSGAVRHMYMSLGGKGLNMEKKTNIMKFTASNRLNMAFQVRQDKLPTEINHTKFLGLKLDKNIKWKNHIQKFLPKLGSACYLIRRMSPFCNLTT
jgi:hypothetical protein